MTMDYERALKLAEDFIKSPGIEGCELVAYPDPAWNGKTRNKANWTAYGIPWTVGWGDTKGVREGDVWTQEYADARLKTRLESFMEGVLKACPQLNQENPEKLAACVCLAYNIGLGAFGTSTVCRLTNKKDYVNAAEAFNMWVKAKGKVLNGLVTRRKKEAELYLSGG